jgi:hypothetical protein
VEATERIVNGLARKKGVVAAGEVFDARDFLKSPGPAYLTLDFCDEGPSSPVSR